MVRLLLQTRERHVRRLTQVMLAGAASALLFVAVGTAPASAHDHDHDGWDHTWNHATPRPEPTDDDDDHDDSCGDNASTLRHRDDDPDDCPPPPPPPPPPDNPPPPPAPEGRAPDPAPAQVVAPVLPAIRVDGYLSCGGVATETGGLDIPRVSLTRLDDAVPGVTCDPLPYTLTTDTDSLTFHKTGADAAQFVLTVEWQTALEPPAKTDTFVDFELVPGFEVLMPTCPTAVREPGTGDLVGLSGLTELTPEALAALGIVDQDGVADNDITQFACVGSRYSQLVSEVSGTPTYLVTEEIYLLGDVIMRSH